MHDPVPELTPDAEAVYEWALTHDGMAEDSAPEGVGLSAERVAEGCRILVELRLLRAAPHDGWLFPVSPEAAVAELVGPLEAEIHQRRIAADRTRAMMGPLHSVYFSSRRTRNSNEAIDVVEDVSQVRHLIGEVARKCTEEVFTVQPTALTEETLSDSRPRDMQLLERGVRMRTLYPHTVLSSPAVQTHFLRMANAGSEIRTTTEVTDRIIIFDREIAFMPDRSTEGAAPGAVVVRQPVIVEYLYQSLERAWGLARPFVHTGFGYGDGVDGVADGLKEGIVRLLAAGFKDEAVAKRMNMSVRTCRRHIAELMEELGAESRFQAGVMAADHGLLAD